jgi:hypothetical protein
MIRRSVSVREQDRMDWVHVVRSEYREMPGLSLTEMQAQRLWQLDAASTRALLSTLLDTGFLRRTTTGTYIRADAGAN